MGSRFRLRVLGYAVAVAIGMSFQAQLVRATCPEGSSSELDPIPNVTWTFRDSVAGCPGGDTLVFSPDPHHPSRLRIVISYVDDDCNPRAGVPPESIYVVVSTYTGNAKANDQPKVYADDSTNASGQARVTVQSLSGDGKVKIRIFVSGVEAGGYSTPTVRTVDTNADGVVTSADATGLADINYNGSTPEGTELFVLSTHQTDWHRQVLFGTPVKRTNLVATSGAAGSLGSGYESWEPTGKRLAISIHGNDGDNTCAVHFVPADPADGNATTKFTFPPEGGDDYDPSWSPRDIAVAWDRGDTAIFIRGVAIAGLNADTTVTELCSSNAGFGIGDILPAVSPDSRSVVFSRLNGTTFNLWTISVAGGSPTQITTASGVTDWNAAWSPDGSTIIFQRKTNGGGGYSLYSVPSTGGTPTQLFTPVAADTDAIAPSYSPDGKIAVAALGGFVLHAIALDPGDASSRPIRNFSNFAVTVTSMFPRLSPDGTRTAFETGQLFVVRRNMDLPPVAATIRDTTITAGDSLNVLLSATDPETDELKYRAYFVPTGASFDTTSHRFAWRTSSGNANHSYWVKFAVTEITGGVSSQVVKVSVLPFGFRAQRNTEQTPGAVIGFGNPSRNGFALATPYTPAVEARLSVFNAAGRLVAERVIASGQTIVWNAQDAYGTSAKPGIYFYRLTVGVREQRGKWIVIR
jgi:hypothetical protein